MFLNMESYALSHTCCTVVNTPRLNAASTLECELWVSVAWIHQTSKIQQLASLMQDEQ